MAKQRRRRLLGLALVSSSLLFCCVVPFIRFDPLLNVLWLGRTAPPTIPDPLAGQGVQRRVEQDGLSTHTITTFRTTDPQAAVIDFYARRLGPPNGKWRQTSTAHYPHNPRIARTWVYDDYCPATRVDLTFAPVVLNERLVSGLTDVEVRVTRSSCRDRLLVIILMNLFPPSPPTSRSKVVCGLSAGPARRLRDRRARRRSPPGTTTAWRWAGTGRSGAGAGTPSATWATGPASRATPQYGWRASAGSPRSRRASPAYVLSGHAIVPALWDTAHDTPAGAVPCACLLAASPALQQRTPEVPDRIPLQTSNSGIPTSNGRCLVDHHVLCRTAVRLTSRF